MSKVVVSTNIPHLERIIARRFRTDAYVVVTDTTVGRLHANKFAAALRRVSAKPVHLLSFPPGENSKNQATVTKLCHAMLQKGCDRGTVLIAFGGGVVGDVGGYVAATYMRGITYVHVPTTLLAMADSSIGGKTGIDTPYGKNMIGAFWQPAAVFSDVSYLKTLPDRHIKNGLAEMLKIFMTSDGRSLGSLEDLLVRHALRDLASLGTLIKKAVAIKLKVVAADERERELRKILNFGHTIGHAIEHLSRYRLLHGEAVALGMLVEAKASELMGILPARDYARLEEDIAMLGVLKKIPLAFGAGKVLTIAKNDKKSRDSKIYCVLVSAPGRVHNVKGRISHSVEDGIIKRALQTILK